MPTSQTHNWQGREPNDSEQTQWQRIEPDDDESNLTAANSALNPTMAHPTQWMEPNHGENNKWNPTMMNPTQAWWIRGLGSYNDRFDKHQGLGWFDKADSTRGVQ